MFHTLRTVCTLLHAQCTMGVSYHRISPRLILNHIPGVTAAVSTNGCGIRCPSVQHLPRATRATRIAEKRGDVRLTPHRQRLQRSRRGLATARRASGWLQQQVSHTGIPR